MSDVDHLTVARQVTFYVQTGIENINLRSYFPRMAEGTCVDFFLI